MKAMAKHETWMRRSRRVALAAVTVAAVALTGCDDEYILVDDCPYPDAPVGVYSITGDREVTVYWTPADRDDDSFVVYRARNLNGPYRAIAETGRDYFVDRGVSNGTTYFYALSAVNACGYESDLSRQVAMDTPRPEGYGDRLQDANGEDWRRSAWDFSAYRSVAWDAPSADLIFLVEDGVPFLLAADVDTDIQHAGYVDFELVDWAPDGGWSPTGSVEVIAGHCYIVWTRDNHFAKLCVRSVTGGRVEFDWAYQTDTGNPELKPRQREGNGPLAASLDRSVRP